MREQEIREVIESSEGKDWTVEIIYEYDGGIQVNGVYEVDGDIDLLGTLDKDQLSQVEMHCIDHYSGLCDAAQAAEEDRGDWLYEQRKDSCSMADIAREEQQLVLAENEKWYGNRYHTEQAETHRSLSNDVDGRHK